MYAFPLADDEYIIKKDMATVLTGDKAGMGALYLTTERVVFVGYERTSIITTLAIEVPLEHIDELRAEKTFRLLPNAIVLTTIRGDLIRILVRDRDRWIESIRTQMDKI